MGCALILATMIPVMAGAGLLSFVQAEPTLIRIGVAGRAMTQQT